IRYRRWDGANGLTSLARVFTGDLSFAKTPSGAKRLIWRGRSRENSGSMVTLLLRLLRLLPFLCGAHRHVVCLPLIGPIGSSRPPKIFVMEPTDAGHLHHPALARRLHPPRLRRVLSQR